METMYNYFDVIGNGVADPPPIYSSISDRPTQTIRYTCSKCDSLFTSRKHLHAHELGVHNHLFHCPFCPILFSNKADFRTHVLAHAERYLPCASCNQVFYEEDKLRAHMKEHEAPMFPCDRCDAWFNQYSLLRIHHKEFHVHKKFVHDIPEVSKNCLSKKLLKKVRKELKLVSKMTQAKKQHRVDTQTTDAAAQDISALVIPVPPVVSVHEINSEIQPNDDMQSDTQNVLNSDQGTIRRSRRTLKKTTNLSSDTSSTGVSAPEPNPCASEKTGIGQSAKKPTLEKKKPLKRKKTTQENANSDSTLALSASSESNETDSAGHMKRKLRKSNSKSRSHGTQITDSAVQVSSAPATSVPPVVFVHESETNSDIQPNDDMLSNPQNVINSDQGTTRKSRRALKKTTSVSAPEPYPCASEKTGTGQSAKKPTLEKKKPLKRKKTTQENADPDSCESNETDSAGHMKRKLRKKDIESVDDMSGPLTSCESNERDPSSLAKMNSKRNLRPRTTGKYFYCEYDDSDEEITLSLRNNENFSSKAEMDSKQNVHPGDTFLKSKRESTASKTKANRNLRDRAEKKNAVCDKTSQPMDNKTKKPTSSRSDCAPGFFMCLSCKRIFLTYRLLNQHKELHIYKRGVRCNECGGLFGAGHIAAHRRSGPCGTT